MSWDWLKDGLGGAADYFTGGLTDFDNKGSSGPGVFGFNQFDPIGGGSDKRWGEEDKFGWKDAVGAFTQGYAGQMGPGGSTPGGSSFLNAYTSGKGATPSTSSPVSTSSAFTAGGKTHSMPGIIIDEPVDFYAFKDNVQYPVPQGSSGSSKGPSTGDKIKSGIIDVGKAFLTKMILCDIRVKTDISPLETTEVNDDLAQAAFFVKELRECS